MNLALLLGLACLAATAHASSHMKLVYGWHEIEYTFPDDGTREAMINDGRYIPGNSVPIAMEVDIDTDRVFISMPRFRPGNAATLATVSNRKNSKGEHMLTPYPDWRWHRQGDCEGITSVFRTYIDECRRIWILDTGTVGGSVDVSVGVNRICPAQILIFDLDTNKMIKRFQFPENIIKPESVLTTIVVDVRDKAQKCRNSWAYVADVSGFGILVYDHERNDAWRVQSNEMYPMPAFGFFDIAGSQFDLMDGVLALALTPKEPGKDRTLYFHSLSGDRENWVASSLLRNKSNFEGGANRVIRQFYTSPGKRDGQAASEAFDENGVLFFSVLPRLSINCWNSAKEYKKENIVQVDQDPEMMQFASGLKVKKNKQGVSEVWVLTSRFQMHMLGGVDPNVMNYRLMKAPVANLVRGTSCEVHGGARPGGGGGGVRPGGGAVIGGGGASYGGGSQGGAVGGGGSRPGGSAIIGGGNQGGGSGGSYVGGNQGGGVSGSGSRPGGNPGNYAGSSGGGAYVNGQPVRPSGGRPEGGSGALTYPDDETEARPIGGKTVQGGGYRG